MENINLSKRIYFTVSSLMLLVIFMFQFSGIIRKKYNSFDENRYEKSEMTGLNSNDEFSVITSEDDVIKSDSRYIVYIGNLDSECGNTVYKWCSYTKRNIVVYRSVGDYHRYNEKYPDAVLLDAEYVNVSKDITTLSMLTDYGINLVFCTLPSYDDFVASQWLSQMCGVSPESSQITASGIKLYDGFLFGGETWYTKENDPVGEFQDMQLTMPWYRTMSGTKTYMSAVLDGVSGEEIENEDQPAVIWRKSLDHAYVFCINGDYIKDISGIGILTAIMSEASDYELYPVVDAQTVVVKDYPVLAFEHEDKVDEYYSRSTSSLLENVIWPDITNLAEASGAKFTFMTAPQLNYSDNNLVSVRELDYFFRLFAEIDAEAGLTTSRDDLTTVEGKLEADNSVFSNYLENYKFLSISAKKSEISEVVQSESEILDGLRTVVTDADDHRGTGLFSYIDNDILELESIISGDKYSFYSDFRAKCFDTALAYKNIELNMSNVCEPDKSEMLWDENIKLKSTALISYMNNSGVYSKCSVAETDKRVREFLSVNYSYEIEGSEITVKIDGNSSGVRFILRTRSGELTGISGGTYAMIETGAYLITADSSQLVLTVSDRN